MKYLGLLLILSLSSVKPNAGTFESEQDAMLKATTKAISKFPTIRQYTKRGLNHIRKKSGLSKGVLTAAEAATFSLVTGKVSTDYIKVRYRKDDLEIKPKVNYWFRDGDVAAGAELRWSFK